MRYIQYFEYKLADYLVYVTTICVLKAMVGFRNFFALSQYCEQRNRLGKSGLKKKLGTAIWGL
jgi:hypothetical protein